MQAAVGKGAVEESSRVESYMECKKLPSMESNLESPIHIGTVKIQKSKIKNLSSNIKRGSGLGTSGPWDWDVGGKGNGNYGENVLDVR